jgi:DNA-binding protein HU-beta
MSKADLVNDIAKKMSFSKAQANRVLNATLDSVKLRLKKGQKVALIGFGTFSVKKRKARAGRNPQTGQAIQIKACKVPAFKAGAGLKKAVR